MMKPIFKKRSRNYYPAKIPVGSYLNDDDGFKMDRFLVVNKGNNVFVDPNVNMKELFNFRFRLPRCRLATILNTVLIEYYSDLNKLILGSITRSKLDYNYYGISFDFQTKKRMSGHEEHISGEHFGTIHSSKCQHFK